MPDHDAGGQARGRWFVVGKADQVAAPAQGRVLDGDGAQRWMGVRLSLPDGLPAIGAASGHANLYYCFGHNLNGLMQSVVSACIVAEQAGGRRPAIGPLPYRIERFGVSRNPR